MCFRTKLLKSLLEKDNYDEFGSSILKRHLTGSYNAKIDSIEWQVFSKTLKPYMKEAKRDIEVDALEQVHMSSLQDSRTDVLTEHQNFFKKLKELNVEKSEVGFYLRKCKTQVLAEKLVTDINLQISSPDVDSFRDTLEDGLKSLGDTTGETSLTLRSPEEAFATFDSVNEFEWACPRFNTMAGGFGRERSCLLFALSNMGKSSFTINNIAPWVKSGLKVLDISVAEDTETRRIPHVIQTLKGTTRSEISENYREEYTNFYNEYKENYAFIHISTGTNVSELRKYIKEFQPDILIVDGFGKLSKGKSEVNHAKLLGLISSDLKSMAVEFNLGLVCICQAANTARGKTKLSMMDIADSKVDVAGEFEIIAGIGCESAEPNLSPNRVINFSKSKLGEEGELGYRFTKETNKWEAL